MLEAISVREFARRAGCDEKVVRRKVKTEHLPALADGKIDARYLSVDWRSGDRLPADTAGSFADSADTGETLEEAAERIVNVEGRATWSKAEAERVKENFAALLKQLEFDRESGRVVEIDDVVVAVAAEYALVRNKLLNIGSRVAPKVAVLQSAEEIKALVDEEVVLALKELSIDADGEQDYDVLRQSIQGRFGPASDEAPEGEERGS